MASVWVVTGRVNDGWWLLAAYRTEKEAERHAASAQVYWEKHNKKAYPEHWSYEEQFRSVENPFDPDHTREQRWGWVHYEVAEVPMVETVESLLLMRAE